jgi:hypothetical protein
MANACYNSRRLEGKAGATTYQAEGLQRDPMAWIPQTPVFRNVCPGLKRVHVQFTH